ncbi:RNA ligase [Natronomonas halophila]|uniref:RNA ligase n=1 Tax=Natronomonas halophila TaxID=2747817 RepID=UPI0015B3C9E3|nr:RNA ligase [Natronomonas halophila]QLD84528.1 RNA ligase [Natronomonas halophila]
MGNRQRFGLQADTLESVLEHFETRYFRGTRYRYLPKYRGPLDRGAVLFGADEHPVCGYPKIPRALMLDPGVPEQFDGPFVVEEKLNGYNVRVAHLGGKVVAFTRSGIACPFSTHLVKRRLDLDSLFEARPNLAVCGEVIGPENPYTAYDYPDVESAAFRAFDLRDRRTSDPVPVDRRRELLDAHGLPQTRSFGTFAPDETDAIASIVDELDAQGREGIVMKSVDGRTQLKYTTGASTESDLTHAFSLPFEYGRSFVFQRLLREAFRAVEHDADTTERAHAVGEAILDPLVETIENVDDGQAVGQKHTVRAPPRIVTELLSHLRDQGLTIDLLADETSAGERVVTFRKRMRSTEDKTKAYLDGQPVDY